ncbi:hypothetical protein GALMADRAFT_245030 [Galerina marginata CBS 339.88]|uniref:Protein kinase domain-containing protein n=1 Tax=Galerina marginata (strain CBS 339.88) TaxID=685588 RepID=A0A067T4F2_GALM3|nr:hypothetical protein GALMADRAFT_245030 [Galerina marginata CBS 339.88]
MVETAVGTTETVHFPVGSSVTLHLPNQTASMTILKPFLPFTISQVYLVTPTDAQSNLPSKLVMKVYDPRYFNQRTPHPYAKVPPRAWSLEAETMAVQYRQEIAQGQHVDEPDEHAFFCNLVTEAHLWENRFYRDMECSYESEVGSYEALEDLQGSFIPKLYTHGRLIPTEDKRAIEPYVVLMEYIDGIPLSEVAPGTLHIPSTVYQPLWDVIKTFGERGVLHTDVNDKNLILSPPDAPSRMVLIDFGLAALRDGNDWDDAYWEYNVQTASDSYHMKKTLQGAGVKVS